MTVERTGGHRFDRCQVFCSRCGVHTSQATEKKCMPSVVEVVGRSDELSEEHYPQTYSFLERPTPPLNR